MRSGSRESATVAAVFEREIDAIAHDAQFAGLEIVAHHARAVGGATALSVTIDRAGGADLALCERVAARLNAQLGSFDASYTLEVEIGGARASAGARCRLRALRRAARTNRYVANGRRRKDASRHVCEGCAARRSSSRPNAASCCCRWRQSKRRTWNTMREPIFGATNCERKQKHGNDRKHGN